jgi:Family of unknown function (DUF6928)
MGAKNWMLFYTDGDVRPILQAAPPIDRATTRALVQRLYPTHELVETADGSLADTGPPDGVVLAGCFPRLSIICTPDVALDRPSTLDRRFVKEAGGRTVYLHTMHAVVDWFAFGKWDESGYLERALSLAPHRGLIENVGTPLAFEQPYWAGERRLGDRYPLLFHPLDLAERVLRSLFGFNYDGPVHEGDPDLEKIVLAAFHIRP